MQDVLLFRQGNQVILCNTDLNDPSLPFTLLDLVRFHELLPRSKYSKHKTREFLQKAVIMERTHLSQPLL